MVNPTWLVVFRHPSEKYEFVNWDYLTLTQQKWENNIDGNQTTNQLLNHYK